MHFAVLPPEVNSGRMYAGPGAGSLLAAATVWDELANELHATAAKLESVISGLVSEPWQGPSAEAMAAAATAQLEWLTTTAVQAAQTSTQAKAAVVAYESAFAMTVPPSAIAANRAQLMSLIATNLLGQNAAAIAATEVAYAEMWAQDVAAMYGYAGSSRAATKVTPFTPPQQTTNQGGLTAQTAATAQAGGTAAGQAQTALSNTNAMSAVPNALHTLASSSSGLTDFSSSLTPYQLVSLGSGLLGNGVGLIGLSGAAGFISEAEHNAAGNTTGLKAVSPPPSSDPGNPKAAAPDGRLPKAATAVSAGTGRGASLGGLSVPEGWTAAAPEMRLGVLDSPVAAAVPASSPGSGLLSEMPLLAGAPLMALSGRGASGSQEQRPGDKAGAPGHRVRAGSAAPDRAQKPHYVPGGRPTGPAAEVRETTELLGKLADLRDDGILTDQEFLEQKQRLLGGR